MNQSTTNQNNDVEAPFSFKPHRLPLSKEWYHNSYSKNLLELTYKGSDQDDIQSVVDAVAHDCEIRLPHNAFKKKIILRGLILNLFFLHCDSDGKHCLKIRTNEKYCEEGTIQYEVLPARGKVIQEIIRALSDYGVIEYKKGYFRSKEDSAPGKIKLTQSAADIYFGVLNEKNIQIQHSMPVVWKDSGGIKRKPSASVERKAKGPLIDKLNKQTADFEISLDGQAFTTEQKTVFRQFHDKSCSKGGRLVWHGQTISAEDRKRILIEGEKVMSIDIVATYPTFAYAIMGIDATQFKNDPYYCNLMQPGNKLHRKLGKSVLLVLFNVSGSTKGEVVKNTLTALQSEYDEKGKRKDNPHKKVVDEVMPTFPDDVSLKHIVTELYDRNLPISEFFLNQKGDSYYRLSKYESDALMLVIKHCTTNYIPVLTIHDCVIVREKDAEAIRKVYQDAISKALKFEFANPEGLVSVE